MAGIEERSEKIESKRMKLNAPGFVNMHLDCAGKIGKKAIN